MNSFSEITEAINKYDTFYIGGHINPDGDSIGSVNCLKLSLEQLGKKFTENNPQCFIQVDVQPEYRIPKEFLSIKEKAEFSICFDHHQIDDCQCDLIYVDSSASANALIMWEFIKFLGVNITKDIAAWAYYGLCSDTNSFRNTNSDKRSFEAAGEMMEYGVDAARVAQELFQSRSLASFELEKVCLNRLYVDEKNRFALSYLTVQDYEKFKATKADSDALIDLLRELECVDVACIIRQEKSNEKIHGSLRSKTDCDVSLLARLHIGGGHKAAAGLTMEETDMDKAIEIIKTQLIDLMQGNI